MRWLFWDVDFDALDVEKQADAILARVLELGPGYRVSPVPDFYAEVKALLGEAAVS